MDASSDVMALEGFRTGNNEDELLAWAAELPPYDRGLGLSAGLDPLPPPLNPTVIAPMLELLNRLDLFLVNTMLEFASVVSILLQDGVRGGALEYRTEGPTRTEFLALKLRGFR